MLRFCKPLLVFLYGMLCLVPGALGQENKGLTRIVILPFNGSEAGQYAYLTDSLTAMVASRLAAKGSYEVVDHPLGAAEINTLRGLSGSTAAQSLPKISADYIINGSLYAVQSGLQLQLALIPLQVGGEVTSYSAFAQAEHQIMPALEEMTQSAADAMRGLPASSSKAAGQEMGRAVKGDAGFATEHPDRSYRKGLTGSGIIASEGETISVQARGVRRSAPQDYAIIALAAGDLDGDGSEELVMASRSKLFVYRLVGEKISELAQHSFSPGIAVHALSLANLDGAPGEEIYVSASQQHNASSSVFTYSSNQGLRERLGNISWYIRAIGKPGEGALVLGQPSSADPENGYLGRGLVRLRIAADYSSCQLAGQESLPEAVGIFDFAWADLDGDGAAEVVSVDRNSRIKVYNGQNALLWVSSDEYGGSKNYIGPSLADDASQKGNAGKTRLVRFIPARLVVTDIDGDGRQEILVGKNKAAYGQWMNWVRNSREYDGGVVASLSWEGGMLRERWRTNAVSGYIADYSLLGSAGFMQKKGYKMESFTLLVGQLPAQSFLGFSVEENTVVQSYQFTVK